MAAPKTVSARTLWAVLVAVLLLLPALAAQQAWAADGELAAGEGELQTQAQQFKVVDEDDEGNVYITYVGSSDSVKVPGTFGGERVVGVNASGKGLKSIDVSDVTYLVILNCDRNELTELDVSENTDCSCNATASTRSTSRTSIPPMSPICPSCSTTA